MASLRTHSAAALGFPAPKAPRAGRQGVPPLNSLGQAANWPRTARRRSAWNRWSREARSLIDGVEDIITGDNETMDETMERFSWVEDNEELRPRAYLIFNPVAGKGNLATCLGIITSTLLPSMDLVILQTTPDVNAATLARKALEENADIIIASGGDGTISEVAGELIGSGKAMGIIPRGTANAFSVALGIPTHLDNLNYIKAACNVILAGKQRVVDAAWASGEWGRWPLTLLLGIGLEAAMVEAADRDMKNALGPLAYIVAGMKALDRNQPYFDLRGNFDGVETSASRTHAVTIANAAPPASVLAQGLGQVIPDDGLLEMMAFVDEDAGKAKRTIFNMAIKQILFQSPGGADLDDEMNVIGLRAKNVTITCDPPQTVVVDGELLGQTPVTVEVVPGGLVVFAPPPDDDLSRERASLALASELARLRKVMAESAENSKLSQEELLADNNIMIARAKQIEKDLVDLYGFQPDSLQNLDGGILKSSSE